MKQVKNMNDDLFGQPPSLDSIKNKRIATRFIRKDITTFVSEQGLFGYGNPHPVELKDITSKGVLIKSNKPFTLDKKVMLSLQFRAGRSFQIKAVIVRHSHAPTLHEYGIKFETTNEDLGEYLVTTQTKLRIKS
jgi:hypothetical protein